ncbi:MAG TPA: YebC/PmpR family DNA-binding transcriptional regulator [Acidiferrobacteraceae bacterium]|nr:YebC/PmpR family DNA-binding transcriptional regulator [Acidiferrobacteraceae bacterium]
MAGHSKWANIRFRKAAKDAKRGKVFTKLIREITVAARMGGGDPEGNPRLRAAVDKALGQNMNKDNVDRAIKRGTGELEGVSYEDARYEGYGPGGAAVLVECATDNRNRTVSEVRHAFTKHGGNLGTDGSVAYLFNKIGLLTFPQGSDEEQIMEIAVNVGADDVVSDEDSGIEVTTPPEQFQSVYDALAQQGLKPELAEITMRASTDAALTGADAERMLKMVDALEELDDVQEVYTNADIPDEVVAQLEAG